MWCVSFAGTTPQRREYMYPRVLNKPRSREELEEEFRAQQEELQCALSQCETVTEVEEEKPLDQVSQSQVYSIHILSILQEEIESVETLSVLKVFKIYYDLFEDAVVDTNVWTGVTAILFLGLSGG